MAFWIGILVSIAFVYLAIKVGFFEMWVMLFNITISIYLAIFLRPIIADFVPIPVDASYNDAIIVVAIGIVTFLIVHAILYVFFTGQFNVSCPKIFDILGAGFLGCLAGYLVWSFAILLICITPISQQPIVKKMGLHMQLEQANVFQAHHLSPQPQMKGTVGAVTPREPVTHPKPISSRRTAC